MPHHVEALLRRGCDEVACDFFKLGVGRREWVRTGRIAIVQALLADRVEYVQNPEAWDVLEVVERR